MAKAKGSKAPVKHLHKGKKLEEQKPLKAGKVSFNPFQITRKVD